MIFTNTQPHYPAFVCERDSQFAKVFDCKVWKLHEAPYDASRVQPVLSSYYYIEHKNWQLRDPIKKFGTNVQFYVGDYGLVHVNSIAVSPAKGELEPKYLEKYSGKVWSEYLGFLNDPFSLFPAGAKAWIKAQYSPRADSVFDIVEVGEQIMDSSKTERTPWESEQSGFLPKRIHPSELIRMDLAFKKKHVMTNSLCIHRTNDNNGRCALLFNLHIGVFRWYSGNRMAEVGSWYQHKLNDERLKRGFEKKPVYYAITAGVVMKTNAQVPTYIDRKLKIRIQLNMEEIEGNRADRYSFYDILLGKVHISLRDRTLISKHINEYYEWLNEMGWTRDFAFNLIDVFVVVILRENFLDILDLYPSQGVFIVDSVEKIAHQQDDFPIFERELEVFI